MTLLVSLASYILAFLHSHTAHASHIYNNNTFTLPSCLGIEEIIYYLFHYAFIQLKINELYFITCTSLLLRSKTFEATCTSDTENTQFVCSQ